MRSTLRAWVSLVAALAAGCAHHPPPALHGARLVIQTTRTSIRPFVRATVAGQPMSLLLDTGAARSILPAGFARARGLRRGPSVSDEQIVDGNGKITRMPYLLDVPVQFEGEPSGGTMDFLMNTSGQMDEGVLAPQDLVRPGFALVIDLEHEQLWYEPEEAALKRLGERASLQEEDFSRCLAEGFFEKAHRVVFTTINGVPAKMLIDTGAEHTVLARNNPALPSMAAAMGLQGTVAGMGSMGSGLVVDDVPIVFAKTSFVLPALVVPASATCGHGVLGVDLLRHCTLVWGWSSLWAACRAPAGGRASAEGAPR